MNKKSNKNITCWIITEGIAGTENQCIGVAEAMGLDPVVKHVALRFPWKQLTPHLRLLNGLAFSEKSDSFTPPWPDLVISSGRKSIPAALHIKNKSQGKTFVAQIQDPRCPPDLFDLVILPSHDPTRGENVITTIGSLNRITEEKLQQEVDKFPPFFKENRPSLAVLIGGNSKAHQLTYEITQKLCRDIQALSKDYNIMVTASRRTGAENHALLMQELSNNPAIYFWDGTGDNPYFAFLERANKILVTEDSASMISEAITTGRPTYIIPLQGGGKRINRFHQDILEQGYAKRFENGILEDFSPKALKETERVAKIIAQSLKNR